MKKQITLINDEVYKYVSSIFHYVMIQYDCSDRPKGLIIKQSRLDDEYCYICILHFSRITYLL